MRPVHAELLAEDELLVAEDELLLLLLLLAEDELLLLAEDEVLLADELLLEEDEALVVELVVADPPAPPLEEVEPVALVLGPVVGPAPVVDAAPPAPWLNGPKSKLQPASEMRKSPGTSRMGCMIAEGCAFLRSIFLAFSSRRAQEEGHDACATILPSARARPVRLQAGSARAPRLRCFG